MKRYLILFGFILAATIGIHEARADAQQPVGAVVVSHCGAETWTADTIQRNTQDTTGIACGTTGSIPYNSSTTAENCHVISVLPGSLAEIDVSPSVAGWLMLFDTTTCPTNGAVTPKFYAQSLAGAGTFSWTPGAPAKFATGIVAVYSSTGPLTLTLANAYFSWGAGN